LSLSVRSREGKGSCTSSASSTTSSTSAPSAQAAAAIWLGFSLATDTDSFLFATGGFLTGTGAFLLGGVTLAWATTGRWQVEVTNLGPPPAARRRSVHGESRAARCIPAAATTGLAHSSSGIGEAAGRVCCRSGVSGARGGVARTGLLLCARFSLPWGAGEPG